MGRGPVRPRTCSAKTCSAKDLFGQGPVRPRTCSAKDLFGQGPVRPKHLFGQGPVRPKHLFGQGPVRPRTCSAKDLFGHSNAAGEQSLPIHLRHATWEQSLLIHLSSATYQIFCRRLTFQALPYPAGGRGSLKLWPELPSPTGEGNGRVAALCAQLRSNPPMGEG